jgi:dsDNA-specific endonuclease/ATPase MutS2
MSQRYDDDTVEVPITDVFDLHPFRPSEVSDVVRAYLDEAWERGFEEVRIIHGRGTGTQRRTVRTVLERDRRVATFRDAPPEAGGWGATLARFVEGSRGEPGPGQEER